jgi:hypothetical protein
MTADDTDDTLMRSLYRWLDDLDLPDDPPFDAEAALRRFRAGMAEVDRDPAERARIEDLARSADDEGGDMT